MRGKITRLILVLSAAFGMVGCASSAPPPSQKSEKPVILIAGFGSSYETGQRNLEDFDKAVRAAFPDHEILWGFTASFVVEKLRKAGMTTLFESKVPILHLEEAFTLFFEQGKRKVLVVNFLIMRGAEYRQVLDTPTTGLDVKYVHSLLYYDENIQNAVHALDDKIANDDETATIFCAHGNGKNLQYNAELELIDIYLREHYKNTYMVSMEGTPAWPPVREAVLASGVSRVRFIPFMLTYGDHISNDAMGDGTDSFKTQLGLPAEAEDGLASIPSIQNIFIERMRAVLAQFSTRIDVRFDIQFEMEFKL